MSLQREAAEFCNDLRFGNLCVGRQHSQCAGCGQNAIIRTERLAIRLGWIKLYISRLGQPQQDRQNLLGRLRKALGKFVDGHLVVSILTIKMNHGHFEDVLEDLLAQPREPASGRTGARWSSILWFALNAIFVTARRFFHGPVHQFFDGPRTSLQATAGGPVRARRPCQMDQRAIRPMNCRQFSGGRALPIEYEFLTVVRNPREIRTVFSEENDHRVSSANCVTS